MTCPILMIAAAASRQGKTLFTAALARYYRQQGYKVQVFKIGPDFLDPKILEQASGQSVHNLDLWMMGEEYCRSQLINARQKNDIVLVESVMGLFDHEPSNADFALLFDIPILLLIDASSMAASFAAVAWGLVSFQAKLRFVGIVANRVGSKTHEKLITKMLPSSIRFIGIIPRSQQMQLPERHLGLYQPEELSDFDTQLDLSATALSQLAAKISLLIQIKTSSLLGKGKLSPAPTSRNHKKIIAIAQDAAFSFIYQANLLALQSFGFDYVFFSPINDAALPDCDAIWLPGGYPELYAEGLSNNLSIKHAIIKHAQMNKPIYAECGGMLYLFDSIQTKQGDKYKMCGLLSGEAIMESTFQGIGLQKLCIFDDEIRGHSFHHARIKTTLSSRSVSEHQRMDKKGEIFYSEANIQASFLHCWFLSSEKITKNLFGVTA